MSRNPNDFSKISYLFRRKILLLSIFALVGVFWGSSNVFVASAQEVQNNDISFFTSASQEFGVPLNILLALSYNESRWKSHAGMSSDGGYGLMDLRTYPGKIISGRDGSTITSPKQPERFYTLDQAAQLLQISSDIPKTNAQENIRGAAAVLAQDAKNLNGGIVPTDINDWYGAIADYSGASDPTTASAFADDVYNTIKNGASSDDPKLDLPATPNIQPNKSTMSALGLKAPTTNLPGQNPECPPTLNCRFIAAAYAQDDPNDPGNYGNFDYAHRPADMQIRYIYIHDTEGSYDSTISYFQNPLTYVSVHYVIRSSDGAITQMVPDADVAWGIANWNMNMHGINIEHEGFAAQGATWYTEAMYQSSAKLVRWLAAKYNIPLDRQHILGHDNVMYGPAAGQAAQHWDPGPYWDWNHYMALLHDGIDATAKINSNTISENIKMGQVIIIHPNFNTNQPIITDCQTGTCFTLASQGANFVYLHTQPRDSSPLLSDPYLHTDGSAGTTEDADWGDKASSGFKYVVAGVQGAWTGIWYGGQRQIGWFYNPQGSDRTAYRNWSKIVTLKPGLSTAQVYTEPYPEATAYPSVIPVQPLNNAYTISAGQKYTTPGDAVHGDYFYDATINYSLPDDHMVVVGKQKYYEITFNHHVGFVKVDDVVVTP